MVDLALARPRTVFAAVAVLTLALGSQIPRIAIDTDPENMLPAEQADRRFHDEVKARFNLHDVIVVGVVDETDPDGVFNPGSLARIHELSGRIQRIDGVIRQDLMSPSTVDNVTPEGEGTIRFDWLLGEPPTTRTRAHAIRDAARRLPMLDGFLISEDGRAVAMYVPIARKDESYRITREIEAHIAELEGPERYFITGLPAAEDTFGVQMFEQMAISAPLAALVIFLLMAWFFRSLALIAAPMMLAMGTVIATMGLLIGLGFTVHIMSSMIPIFLMPIAVVDSVHVLSEFADRYRVGDDPRGVIRAVMGELYTPMLYTSLTSAAGFASLALTPIPPVRVFGVFVAIGIGLAFVLTVVFVPAYIVSLSPKRLKRMRSPAGGRGEDAGLLAVTLRAIGRRLTGSGRLVLVAAAVPVAVSLYGITLIRINDNPVRWFHSGHPIRVADEALNAHFGGTYPAYLVLTASGEEEARRALHDRVRAALDGGDGGPETGRVLARFEQLADALPTGSHATRLARLTEAVVDAMDAAPDDEYALWESVLDAVEQARAAFQVFQSPQALAYVEALQGALEEVPVVGKTVSLPDIVKTLHRDLRDGDEAYYTVPDSARRVAQTLLSFQSSHRPDDLRHFVTSDYRSTNIWVQLRSGDNRDMRAVETALATFVERNPPPEGVELAWSGATHINLVWQGEMVRGMASSLIGAFVAVFLMMTVLFRSLRFGVLSMIPLTLTILVIYGIIGLVGKDYDMPVAVLSSLTLGLSIDFAIHFLQRARSIHAETGRWRATLKALFEEPARAISRNAIVIAIGFTPLLAAPLVPYNTVGILMAAIMAVSGAVTLVLLPAICATFARRLFADAPFAEEHT